MPQFRNKLLATASVAAAADAVLVSGLTAATASPATASVSPAALRTEHLQIMSTSETSSNFSLIATGAFSAGGVDVSGGTTDTAKFAGGTFKIRHRTTGHRQSFSPKSCLSTVNQHGTYKLAGGTGKYAGISGSGKFTLRILIVAARTRAGKCTMKKKPVASQLIITAAGPVQLPK
jgi:hypothetical protein